MRIIGGEARGRRLFAPEGLETRPTADKVRESLFNILRLEIPGARVLDLFAGSGALALEAISRGAEFAALSDCSRKAMDAIRRNVEACRAQEKTRLLLCDWRRAIEQLTGPFDLVFLDPPYRMTGVYGPAAALLYERGLLSGDAVLVMEHASDTPLSLPEDFEVCDERVDGAAAVAFVRRRAS